MKKFTLLLLSLWAVLFVVQPVYAGFISQPKQTETAKPTKKFQQKADKMAEKAEKIIQKLSEKQNFMGKILKKHGDIKNKWFKPMIIALAASVILAILSYLPILGLLFDILSYLAYVAFVILFVLWLLTLLDVM